MLPWLPTWVWVLLLLLVCVYIYGTWTHNYFVKLKLPFVRPVPLLGNFASFAFRFQSMADMIVDIYNEFPTEKITGFFQFNQPMIMVKDPELIKQITVKDFEYFTDHRALVTAEGDPLFGRNLFSLKGQQWRDMRHTLSPAFTSSKMKAMFHLVSTCGEQMVDYLERTCKESKDGMASLDMKDFYTKYTNDVIATSAFGIQCDTLKNSDSEFYKMGKEATTFGGFRSIIVLLFFACPKIMELLGIGLFSEKLCSFFRTLVHSTIATREREGIIRPDMIHILMQARKGTLKNEESDDVADKKTLKAELSDDDITAQALLFFFAGFDTTSTLLCFMSHLLAAHQEQHQRVQEEIDATLKDYGGKLTYEGLQQMKYLDMVMSETLRLWPPALASDRICVKPYVLPATDTTPSVMMEVGIPIMIPTYAIQRDASYFPDPDKFDPERFSEENIRNIQPFTYLPFGVGPRVCIGQRFAQMEAKVAMVYLLRNFNLQMIEKSPVHLRLNRKAFNMVVEGGFWLGIKPRH